MQTATEIDLHVVAQQLKLHPDKVRCAVDLLDAGNTIPFITRYRKDQTGGLTDPQLREVREHVSRLRSLAERKGIILKTIEAQGLLTEPLKGRIVAAANSRDLEDLYLPFKPRKQTLAAQARQRGLDPLAQEILEGDQRQLDLATRATEFVRVDKQLTTVDQVILGVQHLLAERFSESVSLRNQLRTIVWKTGEITCKSSDPSLDSPAETDAAPQSLSRPADSSPADRQPAQGDSARAGEGNGAPQAAGDAAPPIQAVAPAGGNLASAGQRTPKNKRRGKEKRKQPFLEFKDFREAIRRIPPHRILAINRGERAGLLRVKLEVDEAAIQQAAVGCLVPVDHPFAEFLSQCAQDAVTRLVLPSVEREVRRELTERAEQQAVTVFSRNLRHLLLQPPVRGKKILAIDPGFRTGCKAAVLDSFGNPSAHMVFHIVGAQKRRDDERSKLVALMRDNQIDVIAIGNGKGCRATEQLIAEILAGELAGSGIRYTIVNQAGASVYSTSDLGREELAEYEPVIRSAISIGRRLLDPLSELVKIAPAHIGVGMYQHDVKAKHLSQSLDEAVESCVNYVGADVNTASPALLRHVAGLGQLTARRLFDYRCANGPLKTRQQLLNVPGIGEATFVQAAGFLRIYDGENPLDGTPIHPESYPAALSVLEMVGASVEDLKCPAVSPDSPSAADVSPRKQLLQKLSALDAADVARKLSLGHWAARDLLAALSRGGRDPRSDLPPPIFRDGILKVEDLQPGMQLYGQILNVVDFGVFVDIGLGESCLIHISRLSDRFVRNPHLKFAVGDTLKVWVQQVDKERRRIVLTAVQPGTNRVPASRGKENRPRDRARASQGRSRPLRKPKLKTFQAGRKRPKIVTPITQEMVEGKKPMRSFSDLAQFYKKKNNPASNNE